MIEQADAGQADAGQDGTGREASGRAGAGDDAEVTGDVETPDRPSHGDGGRGESDEARSSAMRGARRIAVGVLIGSAVCTVVALIWLWPSAPKANQPDGSRRVTGEVISVTQVSCPDLPTDGAPPGAVPVGNACGTVKVRLSSGPDTGKEVITQMPLGPGAPSVGPGDPVVLMYLPDMPAEQAYQISDHQRGSQLWILAIAFVLAVVVFGRWRGVTSLAGLAVTFAVLLLFIVPAILAGRPPLLIAIVGSSAIMLSVLYLTHGFTVTTSVAVLGVFASLVLTGVLAAVSVAATHLTGVVSEDDIFLSSAYHNVNMQGLLLAAILVGSLGVVDDVAVTQAVTVAELARADPDSRPLQMYRSAMRVGRAHIASVINTIILAYAGASLPVLLLVVANGQPLTAKLTNPFLAQEVVRSIVGTLGLIAAVPVTTALAAFTATGRASRPSTPPRRFARTRRVPINVEADNPYEALLFRPRREHRPG